MRKFCVYLTILFAFLPVFILNAQEVDLLWYGDNYAPPFYKGQVPWTKMSMVRFVAIPHGLGNPAGLNYQWTQNGTILGAEGGPSGPGKNNMIILDSILSKTQTIEVDLVTEGAVLAHKSVTITPRAPELVVYENSPLYGYMFHKEFDNSYKFSGNEFTLTAFPLFFSVARRIDNNLEYSWVTNTNEEDTTSSVTYRTPDNASGSSGIQVHVANKKELTQDARKNFLIKFGDQDNL